MYVENVNISGHFSSYFDGPTKKLKKIWIYTLRRILKINIHLKPEFLFLGLLNS